MSITVTHSTPADGSFSAAGAIAWDATHTLTGFGTAAAANTTDFTSSTVVPNTTPTNGQLLIGNGTNYSVSTLTAGSNISITNAAGSITIASTSGGVTLAEVRKVASLRI